MSHDKDRALPKFGEWDVNNPASAEGFTVIFNKARDEKKTSGVNTAGEPSQKKKKKEGGLKPDPNYEYRHKSRKWLCCGC